MKKFLIIASTIMLVVAFAGCSKVGEVRPTEVSEEEQYYLELAEKANSETELFDILVKNDSERFQNLLATQVKNKKVQEALLMYDKLHKSTLIAILEAPNLTNIKYIGTRDNIINQIYNADLTPDEELRIAKTNLQEAQWGVLARENLNYQSLYYILEHNDKIGWTINLDYYKVEELICNQILKMDLTLEESKSLAELKIYNVDQALKAREKQKNSKY